MTFAETYRNNKKLFLVIAAGLALCIIWIYIRQPAIGFYYSVGWSLIIAILLWWGNRGLTVGLDKLLPWSRFGNYRFFIHLLLGLLYLLFLVNLSYVILKVALNSAPTLEQIVVMNAWGAFLFIPVFAIYFSLHFLRHWRKSELEVERFQKEHIRSQLDSLKTHLDPHFLFNNLNILSSLITKDPQKSQAFVDNLADVYRSILKTTREDLISVEEELEFMESYIFLLKTRFQNNIKFEIDTKGVDRTAVIPPLTVQMLVENAIKHNVITETLPLTIEIRAQGDKLLIRNTLRENNAVATTGSGLQNIRSRYAHFTNETVTVNRTATHFEVLIPLLRIEAA